MAAPHAHPVTSIADERQRRDLPRRDGLVVCIRTRMAMRPDELLRLEARRALLAAMLEVLEVVAGTIVLAALFLALAVFL